MAGIIFTGGDAPEPDSIKGILKGIEFISIAADSGLDIAEAAGFMPDWIIGDMDSISDPSRLSAYPPERVMRHEKDKDYTDTELALSFLLDRRCGCVWIIGGGGGRMDHLFGIRSLFERELYPERWITRSADTRCIDAAGRGEASLCVEAGTVVSVFPVFSGPWKAESKGLKWPLDNLVWNRGFASMSNVALTGEFSVRAQEGRFLIIVPFSPGDKPCRL